MRYFCLIVLSACMLTACSDDDEGTTPVTPPPGPAAPDKSAFFINMTVDDESFSFSTEDGDFFYRNFEADRGNACQYDYGAGFRNNFGQGNHRAYVQLVRYFLAESCSDVEMFHPFFFEGPQLWYDADVTNDDGAYITFEPPGGPLYSTAWGPQEEDQFVITDLTLLPDEYDPDFFSSKYIAIEGSFEAVMYTMDGSETLDVTDGSFYLAFGSVD